MTSAPCPPLPSAERPCRPEINREKTDQLYRIKHHPGWKHCSGMAGGGHLVNYYSGSLSFHWPFFCVPHSVLSVSPLKSKLHESRDGSVLFYSGTGLEP